MKKKTCITFFAAVCLLSFEGFAKPILGEDCKINPEEKYQNLMKKKSLTQQEQTEVLGLEKQLSSILLLSTDDPPKCLKNGAWKIDLKGVKARMSGYRHESDGGQWIEWSDYVNSKIPKDSYAYITEAMTEFLGEEDTPMWLNVPAEFNCEGCDGPSKSEQEFLSKLKSYCETYMNKNIRANIRKRTLNVLKAMDSRGMTAEGDRDPTPNQKKKILQARRLIRGTIMDALNKYCP